MTYKPKPCTSKAEYIPARFPVYTVDPQGRIREYTGVDAWLFFKQPDEQRLFKKDLPKGCEIYEQHNDIDV